MSASYTKDATTIKIPHKPTIALIEEPKVAKIIGDLRLTEYDLAKAKSKHIERSAKSVTNPSVASAECDKKNDSQSTNEHDKESNLDIMNSRED